MLEPSLHWIDIGVIVVYLSAMLGMGLYFMRRQKSTSEFLLASRSVGWFAIGLSLLSSLNSAMDYVVGPAAYLQWGLILSASMISIVIAFPIVFKLFIPFYQRLRVYNCYEYLEHRFHLGVRLTASLIFILWRICWMGFTLYLPAYVLNVVMGLPLIETVVALGIITTTYTTLGGVRAVVWTDVAQALIMFTGIILAIALLLSQIPGGLAGVWSAARDADLIYFSARIPGWDSAGSVWEKVSLYFHFPITFWAIVVATFLGQLNNYGSDQVMIQRYLSARSLVDCKKGFLTNALAYLSYVTLFMILSMSLLAYFQHHPLPQETQYEYYFPYFIGTRLPPVIKGLILVAIYSAAQSSVSAGISASTSVIYANFYQRLWLRRVEVTDDPDEEVRRRHVLLTRLCALAFGVAVTTLACFIKDLGPLFPLANKIVSCFSGVMIPIFLLGMFVRRARSLGVALGAIGGVLMMFLWGFGHDLGFWREPLGYGWVSTIGFFTTVIVCAAVSVVQSWGERLLGVPAPEKQTQWLWRQVMARPATCGLRPR